MGIEIQSSWIWNHILRPEVPPEVHFVFGSINNKGLTMVLFSSLVDRQTSILDINSSSAYLCIPSLAIHILSVFLPRKVLNLCEKSCKTMCHAGKCIKLHVPL